MDMVYLLVVIAFIDAPSVSFKVTVPGGVPVCQGLVDGMLKEPPPRVMGKHVVNGYTVGCYVELADKPT